MAARPSARRSGGRRWARQDGSALAYDAELDTRAELNRIGTSVCWPLWLTSASLVDQTVAEIHRFLPGWTVLTLSGPEMKGGVRARKKFIATFGYGPDVLVMSYELAHSRRHFLQHCRPALLVLDEASNLKNCGSYRMGSPGGKEAATATDIASRSHRVLAMTATPMENNPLERYGVLKAANVPGHWPKGTSENEYVRWADGHQEKWGRAHEAPAGWVNARVPEVREFLAGVLLRRTTKQVGLSLPTVERSTVYVKLSPAQRRAYDAATINASTGLEVHRRREKAGRVTGATRLWWTP